MRKHRTCVALLAALLVMAGASAPALPAQAAADPWSLRVLPEAALRAGGAAAVVALRVSCAADVGYSQIAVRIRQTTDSGRVLERWAHRRSHNCGPEPQRFLVPLVAADKNYDDKLVPFAAGHASVYATYGACDDDLVPCPNGSAAGTVNLTDRDDMDRPSGTTATGVWMNLWRQVRLLPIGAQVRPRYAYVCQTTTDRFTPHVDISQRLADGMARSSFSQRSRSFVCDGEKQLDWDRLRPLDLPFRVGPAFARVETYSCDVSKCYFDWFWGEVALVQR